jgi:hypothetical protein
MLSVNLGEDADFNSTMKNGKKFPVYEKQPTLQAIDKTIRTGTLLFA